MSPPPETPHKPNMAIEDASPVQISLLSDKSPTEEAQKADDLTYIGLERLGGECLLDEPAQIVTGASPVLDENSTSSSTDVPFMDWTNFEADYKKALTDANEVEDRLVLEFEKLSKAFVFWAEASAQHDNDRAWKRLKTRERYVQLSEQKLEEKKKHYVEVVQAFQKALKLLGP